MSDEPHDSTVCIKDGASRFGTWTNRFRRRHLPSSAPAGSSSTPNRATRVGALCALTILVGPASLLAASGKQRAAGAPEEQMIVLAHTMGETGQAVLSELATRFMAEAGQGRTDKQPSARLVVRAIDGLNDPGAQAELLLLKEEDSIRLLRRRNAIKPVHALMREARLALDAARPPDFVSPVVFDGQRRYNGLPLGYSTPVMFYNKTALARAGSDPERPPKTWLDWQDVLGRLRERGSTCPYTSADPVAVHVENLSAWHNEPVVERTRNGEGRLIINGLVQIKHLAMMESWRKSHYLRVFSREQEAVERFAAGDCQVMSAPASTYVDLRQTPRLNLGVAPLPYHDDVRGAPQNTVAQGATLWATAGKSARAHAASARFIAFMLRPDIQLEWQRRTGFLGISRSGLIAANTTELMAPEFGALRIAIEQLQNKPVTTDSAATRAFDTPEVRALVRDELQKLWSGRDPAKKVLDDAVARSSGACGHTC
ncbi:MAG: sn-glycerol-3-phosphate-binding periplasmic protein UgpB [Rhodocyclaceae bacterium]|nr:sn-glycerol-3-phosphate-binding periplasmic protein UgpB [Rhodocyclaceae bacterium]